MRLSLSMLICPRRPAARLALASLCLAALAGAAGAAGEAAKPAPAAKTADAKTSGAVFTLPFMKDAGTTATRVNVDALLADPLTSRPELLWLQERRNWAARNATGPDQLEQVAGEFEQKEAFYPAIEMLWLADKMTPDAARRVRINAKMTALVKRKKAIETDVDVAAQMWAGGKPMEAVEQLRTIIKAHPYSETAYQKAGFLYLQSYRTEAGKSDKLIMPGLRATVFRMCYEMFACAVVIDPLLNDAYEQLNQLRELLPDQKEFLRRSNALSEVAMSFLQQATPALAKLDDGKRDPQTMADAAEGLLGANQAAYAALLYRAALQQPGLKAGQASELTESLTKALERLPAGKGDKPVTPAEL